MNTPLIITKACFLSTIIFWTIILSEISERDMPFLILISFIPITIICTATILLTIAPFFRFKNENSNNKDVFKICFPFYSLFCFSICCYSLINSGFNIFVISFCVSAFFTTMQSWVWFSKELK